MTTNERAAGFTIVELMMATVVFGVVLMGVTAAMLQMTKGYQKRTYVARTQSVANGIVQSVSQTVKYSKSANYQTAESGGVKGYCIGGRAFYYVLGRQLVHRTTAVGDRETRHAVVTQPRGDCIVPAYSTLVSTLPSGSKELLGQSMRVAKFDLRPVSGGSGLLSLTVRVIYGDSDLICDGGIAGNCNPDGAILTAAQLRSEGDLKCRTGPGSEYCAMSELTTMIRPGL